MNRLSLRFDELKFKTPKKRTCHLRGIYGTYLKLIKKSLKMSTCNQLRYAGVMHLLGPLYLIGMRFGEDQERTS